MTTPLEPRAAALNAVTLAAYNARTPEAWKAVAYQASADYGYEFLETAMAAEAYVGARATTAAAREAWQPVFAQVNPLKEKLREFQAAYRQFETRAPADFVRLADTLHQLRSEWDFGGWPRNVTAEALVASIHAAIEEYVYEGEVCYWEVASKVQKGIAAGASPRELACIVVTGCQVALTDLALLLPRLEAASLTYLAASNSTVEAADALRDLLVALQPVKVLPWSKRFPAAFEDARTRLRTLKNLPNPSTMPDTRFVNLAAALRKCVRTHTQWGN